MNFHFTANQLDSFEENLKREWALTNGIGGYAGGNILGSMNRTHQGYLIASLHPPVERYVVFNKTRELLQIGDQWFCLDASQHAGPAPDFSPIYTEGQKYLTDFVYDGNVRFTYNAGNISLEKHISLVQGENKVALAYHIVNEGEEASLSVTPLMNFREHNDSSTRDSLRLTSAPLSFPSGCGFTIVSKDHKDLRTLLLCTEGSLQASSCLYDENLQFATEVENEVPGLDTCFTPYEIRILLPAKSTLDFSLVCYVETAPFQSPLMPSHGFSFDVVKANRDFFDGLIQQAGYKDDFSRALTMAANQFLAYRESTGLTTVLAGLPWFTDWGRDTMIAFTGLVLSTRRFDKAEEILLTFARYVSHGMVPNMFPDNGQEPLYNTVDASLWYFYAVYKYLEYNNTKEAYDFIKEHIYPALTEIIEAYKSGTLFSIYMDKDGLIHAGSGLDQVTWMDVRVGEWVVTPRHGKPVEINALWYNALMVMDHLSGAFDASGHGDYAALASRVKESFCSKFWNREAHCLYDVIDDEDGVLSCDSSIRPNQIYAVSLPFSMLEMSLAKKVVSVVREKLFVGVGLRSLDPDHKDYHPIYVGSLAKRDAAYHQGTAWGFLLGGFITAYTKVHGPSRHTAEECLAMISPVAAHLNDNCIGSICEIFDGDSPHLGRGCYAQAWSVGEVLRCYTEDILPFLS